VIKTAFAAKKVAKIYLAVVIGEPPWDETVVYTPL